jgi:hypothetical protein
MPGIHDAGISLWIFAEYLLCDFEPVTRIPRIPVVGVRIAPSAVFGNLISRAAIDYSGRRRRMV